MSPHIERKVLETDPRCINLKIDDLALDSKRIPPPTFERLTYFYRSGRVFSNEDALATAIEEIGPFILSAVVNQGGKFSQDFHTEVNSKELVSYCLIHLQSMWL